MCFDCIIIQLIRSIKKTIKTVFCPKKKIFEKKKTIKMASFERNEFRKSNARRQMQL